MVVTDLNTAVTVNGLVDAGYSGNGNLTLALA
jgi:hypothetical protein